MSVATSSCPRLQSIARRHPLDDRNPLAMEFIGLDPAGGTGHSVVKMGGDAASCRSRRKCLASLLLHRLPRVCQGRGPIRSEWIADSTRGVFSETNTSGPWSESAYRVA